MKKLWTKRTRMLLFVVLGLLLALLGFKLNQSSIESKVTTEKVVMAAADIPPNHPITADMLVDQNMVVSEIPNDAIRNVDELDLNDSFSSSMGFKKGEPLRKSYITSAKDSPLGSSVSLKNGMVEIGVKTDLVLSAGNEVYPGMYVQVQAYMATGVEGRGITKRDPDLERILVKKVVNSEGVPHDSNPENGNVIPAAVTLEVTPEQAERIMAYQESGKVYLLPAGVK